MGIAEADAARLLVLFNTANAYATLRYRERLLDLRTHKLQGRRRTLALVRDLVAEDGATRLETTRSSAGVAELEAQLSEVRTAVQSSLNQLAVLVGQSPASSPCRRAARLVSPSRGCHPMWASLPTCCATVPTSAVASAATTWLWPNSTRPRPRAILACRSAERFF